MQDWTDSPEPWERPGSWAFQLALCLLGPLLFLSFSLTILSPLPILYLHSGTPRLSRGRLWTLLAAVLGATLVYLVSRSPFASYAFVLVSVIPAMILGEAFQRRLKPELAITLACLAMIAAIAAAFELYLRQNGIQSFQEAYTFLDTQVKTHATRLLQDYPTVISQNQKDFLTLVSEKPVAFLEIIPGLLVSGALLTCTIPALALIRWNPKGFLRRIVLPRDYLRKWRSPEWLVWVALFCGAFNLYEAPYLSIVARNLILPLVLIYFFQGMSILAYFLDSLRLRGLFRVFFYGVAIMFLQPMIVSFGFFDLWFNFRGRRKAREEDEES